ncbi:MAG TPA: lysophospholipid acyltransferase family protein [Candidatus Binatia bacterium]|nr:lysophospholipid acyltransferase family protein [Candidatus Binatia bacterium]
MQQLRIERGEYEDDVVTPVGAADASELRIWLNRFLYRGMLFSMGSIAVGLYQLNRDVAWQFAKLSARNLALATGVEVKLFGAENLPREPAIVTPNHASHFDIAALLGWLPGQNRFAAKKELFAEPILGMVMRTLGMVPIDRESPAESIEVLNRMARLADSSLIMFPEGTRSRDGRMGPFKRGAFALAIRLGRPIVPVAIHGSAGVMPPGKYLSILPGTVVVEVLPPIPTKGLSDDARHRLAEQVRDRIATRIAAARETAEA